MLFIRGINQGLITKKSSKSTQLSSPHPSYPLHTSRCIFHSMPPKPSSRTHSSCRTQARNGGLQTSRGLSWETSKNCWETARTLLPKGITSGETELCTGWVFFMVQILLFPFLNYAVFLTLRSNNASFCKQRGPLRKNGRGNFPGANPSELQPQPTAAITLP